MKSEEKPKQLDFADTPKTDEEPFEPEAEEERRRLQRIEGSDAEKAALSKGESMRKADRRKEIGRRALERIRSVIGASRSGDQEELPRNNKT